MPKEKTPMPDFEKSLKKLEDIVQKMEKADVSLEQSLQQFEEGIGLARQCQLALTQAEQQVDILMADQTLPERGKIGD